MASVLVRALKLTDMRVFFVLKLGINMLATYQLSPHMHSA